MTERLKFSRYWRTDESETCFLKPRKLQTPAQLSSGAWRSPGRSDFLKEDEDEKQDLRQELHHRGSRKIISTCKKIEVEVVTTASATRRTFVRVNIRGIYKVAVKAHGGDETANGNSMRGVVEAARWSPNSHIGGW